MRKLLASLLGMLFGIALIKAAPEIQGGISPMLYVNKVEITYRKDNYICWTVSGIRNTKSAPLFYNWYLLDKVQDDNIELISVTRAQISTKEVKDKVEVDYSLCGKFHESNKAVNVVGILGYGEYEASHSLWRISSYIPAFYSDYHSVEQQPVVSQSSRYLNAYIPRWQLNLLRKAQNTERDVP